MEINTEHTDRLWPPLVRLVGHAAPLQRLGRAGAGQLRVVGCDVIGEVARHDAAVLATLKVDVERAEEIRENTQLLNDTRPHRGRHALSQRETSR